jgi:hypothetical protein
LIRVFVIVALRKVFSLSGSRTRPATERFCRIGKRSGRARRVGLASSGDQGVVSPGVCRPFGVPVKGVAGGAGVPVERFAGGDGVRSEGVAGGGVRFGGRTGTG